jgi:RHS repeat-associated protein
MISPAQRLNGSTNEKYGLAKSLSVMPGDKINIEVYAKYVDPNSTNWTGVLPTLMSQIAANTAGVVIDGAGYGTSTSTFPFPTQATTNTSGSSEPGPKAYLNWLVFNKDYQLLTGGFDRISTNAREFGQDVAHERLFSPEVLITEPGYVYIFLSNEEPTPIEVYFDDLKVDHIKSPIVQSDDYYAFGLTFNSYQRENSTTNQYLYNGKEKQDELGLEWLDYGARMYDPAIGRFMVVDALTDFKPDWTPYRYAFNNPLNMIDPSGNYEIQVSLSRQERRELRKIENRKERREARAQLKENKKQVVRDFIAASKSVLDNNPGAKAAFVAFSGIKEDSPEWENLWTENGKGPTINYNGGMTSDDGNGYSKGSKVFINPTNGFAESTVTVMHEYIHYGDGLRPRSARLEGTENGVEGYDAKMQREALNEAFERMNTDPDPSKRRSWSDWVDRSFGYGAYYDKGGVIGVELGFAFERAAFGQVHMNSEDYKAFTAKYLNQVQK